MIVNLIFKFKFATISKSVLLQNLYNESEP